MQDLELKVTPRSRSVLSVSILSSNSQVVIIRTVDSLETWWVGTLTAELERRIQATEMRCYRRLLGISYKDRITNEEVTKRIRQVIGLWEDLLTTVKKRKLKWYGHITRSTGLTTTFLQGTVQGGRKKGGQKKRWEDNIREWTGLQLSETFRLAEDRKEWRKLVVKSSVAPRRSAKTTG